MFPTLASLLSLLYSQLYQMDQILFSSFGRMILSQNRHHHISKSDLIYHKEKRFERSPDQFVPGPVDAPQPERPSITLLFQQVLHAPHKVKSAGTKPELDDVETRRIAETLKGTRAIGDHVQRRVE